MKISSLVLRARPEDFAEVQDYVRTVPGVELHGASGATGRIVVTVDKVSRLSGVAEYRLERLAEGYAAPKRKDISFWTMGFDQHTRGSWTNNMICNVHLLVGKISEPGNSRFLLTGQRSACGTAPESSSRPQSRPTNSGDAVTVGTRSRRSRPVA